jgi:hypothetical protein
MTKYGKQIARARKIIASKGTTVVWFKAGEPVDADDQTPEYAELGEGKAYADIPAVFYPANATTQYTNVFVPLLGMAGENSICCIPGDVPFIPQYGDGVLIAEGDLRHVDLINKTAPDGTAIIYEVSFK